MKYVSADNETERDEAEQRDSFLNHAERAFPHYEPDDKRGRQGPPLETNAGRKFHRYAHAADFRSQHQKSDQDKTDQRENEKIEAEPLADRIWNRMMADGGKT